MSKAKLYLQRRDLKEVDYYSGERRTETNYDLIRTTDEAILTDGDRRRDGEDSGSYEHVVSFCAKEFTKVLGVKKGNLPPRGKILISSLFDSEDYKETVGTAWEVSDIVITFVE